MPDDDDSFTMFPNRFYDQYGAQVGLMGIAVYLGLLRHAGPMQTCEVSHNTLAAEMRTSRSTIRRTLAELEEIGLIASETTTTRAANRYMMCIRRQPRPAEVGSQGTNGRSTQNQPAARLVLCEPTNEASCVTQNQPTEQVGSQGTNGRSTQNQPTPEVGSRRTTVIDREIDSVDTRHEDTRESPAPSVQRARPATARSAFRPPTLEEAKAFFASQDRPASADAFWNYYQAKGWQIGRNAMRDWHAAARGWIAREPQFASRQTATVSANPMLDLRDENEAFLRNYRQAQGRNYDDE